MNPDNTDQAKEIGPADRIKIPFFAKPGEEGEASRKVRQANAKAEEYINRVKESWLRQTVAQIVGERASGEAELEFLGRRDEVFTKMMASLDLKKFELTHRPVMTPTIAVGETGRRRQEGIDLACKYDGTLYGTLEIRFHVEGKIFIVPRILEADGRTFGPMDLDPTY